MSGEGERLVRTFVAVPLPEELRNEIAGLQRRLAERLPEVRWTRPETLHLTLRFFGDRTEEALDKIAAIMLSVSTLSAPFTLRCGSLGCFPHRRRARVLWLALEPPEPLVALQQALARGWAAAGFPDEDRTFRPHLTLGRMRAPRPLSGSLLREFDDTPRWSLRVERLILYESRLKPSGAEHRPRRQALLGGPGGATAGSNR